MASGWRSKHLPSERTRINRSVAIQPQHPNRVPANNHAPISLHRDGRELCSCRQGRAKVWVEGTIPMEPRQTRTRFAIYDREIAPDDEAAIGEWKGLRDAPIDGQLRREVGIDRTRRKPPRGQRDDAGKQYQSPRPQGTKRAAERGTHSAGG